MRIIAGKHKRKKLVTLAGTEITRPTSDRVKENIFNILQEEIADKNILDLYAGSGALGLESLSRGAKKVVFVEDNSGAIECIKNNLISINAENENFQIIQNKVSQFLTPNKNQIKDTFDLIFADPPYNTNWYSTALSEIESSCLCNNNCMVVLEMPIGAEISENLNLKNWKCITIKKYGKTKIEIWRYECEKN